MVLRFVLAFSCLYDEGLPSWRGVDLSLVVTLRGVYVFCLFVFLCVVYRTSIYVQRRGAGMIWRYSRADDVLRRRIFVHVDGLADNITE